MIIDRASRREQISSSLDRVAASVWVGLWASLLNSTRKESGRFLWIEYGGRDFSLQIFLSFFLWAFWESELRLLSLYRNYFYLLPNHPTPVKDNVKNWSKMVFECTVIHFQFKIIYENLKLMYLRTIRILLIENQSLTLYKNASWKFQRDWER